MLAYLKIKNFALINELNIDFSEGLNVITGETGAGKSIIIEAVNVILGSFTNTNLIKSDADFLEIEALFYLDSLSEKKLRKMEKVNDILSENGQIIIRREINRKKRNKSWINNHLVTLSLLQKIGDFLIDLHGQHSHQYLLNPEKHIDFIDNLGDESFLQKKENLNNCFTEWRSINNSLNNLIKNRSENLTKKDYLTFQLEEITKADLKENEDKKLEESLNVIRHNVKIKETMEMATMAVYEGGEEGEPSVRDTLVRIIGNFNLISNLDKNIDYIKEQLSEIQYKIEDISDQINEYKEGIQFDTQQLHDLEDRLSLINHLKQKYGPDLDNILSHKDELQNQLYDIEDNCEKIEKLKVEKEKKEKNLIELSVILSDKRKIIAKKIEKKIINELNELSMKNCKFIIKVKQKEDKDGIKINDNYYRINSQGIDKIEFFIVSNIGEKAKPLADIISGGEVSRIMLALKSVLSKADEIPTMIFDEIDSGVGARLGEVIADKLLKISKNHQVIAVTHLPQIACRANRHFYINKYTDKNKTNIKMSILTGEMQLKEIARMLDGEQYGLISLEHAREMLFRKENNSNEK